MKHVSHKKKSDQYIAKQEIISDWKQSWPLITERHDCCYTDGFNAVEIYYRDMAVLIITDVFNHLFNENKTKNKALQNKLYCLFAKLTKI